MPSKETLDWLNRRETKKEAPPRFSSRQMYFMVGLTLLVLTWFITVYFVTQRKNTPNGIKKGNEVRYINTATRQEVNPGHLGMYQPK